MSGRGVLTRDAQHELWMEFSWADQEYRFSVMQLAAFVERHGVRTAVDGATLPGV